MYNVRYHIASLVAVFLALALGLVLGGLVVRQGGFDQQQQALVAGLRKDFDKLKRDNTSLKASLATERAYSGQMTDAWAAGRLAGRAVIVITSGAKGEGAEYATAAIKSAGGTPVVVTVLKTNLGLGESSTASQAASIVGTATPVKSATSVKRNSPALSLVMTNFTAAPSNGHRRHRRRSCASPTAPRRRVAGVPRRYPRAARSARTCATTPSARNRSRSAGRELERMATASASQIRTVSW